MNELLRGAGPELLGHRWGVAEDGAVLLDGRPIRPTDEDRGPLLGAGLAAAIAGMPGAPERLIAADQSNASVVVDDRVIVKFAGRFGALERSRALAPLLEGSDDVAAVRATALWEHPAHGLAALAQASEYLPGAVDGWEWCVDDALAAVAPGSGRGAPGWPAEVGALVARLHGRLAAGGVRSAWEPPHPSLADVRSAAAPLEPAARARILARADALVAAGADLPAIVTGPVFLGHGDLHLGQLLRATGRTVVVDFDGDPQHEGPGALAPAAVDLAHLLVSVDLAAAVAQRRLGRAETRAWDWADAAREALLAAYRGSLADPELLDTSLLPGLAAARLLAELRYAARFLPRWAYAPDAVIAHRYPSSDPGEETPWTPPPSAPISS